MRIIFGIIILSFGFCLEQNDDIGFSYGILGRLQSQDEKITVLRNRYNMVRGKLLKFQPYKPRGKYQKSKLSQTNTSDVANCVK